MATDELFREKNKRNPLLTKVDAEDVRRFIDLNYEPEEIEMTLSYAPDIYDAEAAETDVYDTYYDAGIPEESAELSKTKVEAPLPKAMPKGLSKSTRATGAAGEKSSLDDIIGVLGRTFQQELLRLIDAKGLSDSEVYKRAEMDRRLFSKIRSNVNYKPSKATAFALAIALELNIDEATDLIGRAGLAFSPSSISDLIVKYCLINKIYDIYEVNTLLYEYDQPLLGS